MGSDTGSKASFGAGFKNQSLPRHGDDRLEDERLVIPGDTASADVFVVAGAIKWFDISKGFGFIKENNSQEKFFFHVNGLLEEVKENDKVSFELESGLKGMNAVRVKKI